MELVTADSIKLAYQGGPYYRPFPPIWFIKRVSKKAAPLVFTLRTKTACDSAHEIQIWHEVILSEKQENHQIANQNEFSEYRKLKPPPPDVDAEFVF